jgi:hypothetical protein
MSPGFGLPHHLWARGVRTHVTTGNRVWRRRVSVVSMHTRRTGDRCHAMTPAAPNVPRGVRDSSACREHLSCATREGPPAMRIGSRSTTDPNGSAGNPPRRVGFAARTGSRRRCRRRCAGAGRRGYERWSSDWSGHVVHARWPMCAQTLTRCSSARIPSRGATRFASPTTSVGTPAQSSLTARDRSYTGCSAGWTKATRPRRWGSPCGTDSQGRGFGGLMMAHLRDAARRHGAIQARLRVHRDDTPSMRLRESHGDEYSGEDRGRARHAA